jgi:hypothetical protein
MIPKIIKNKSAINTIDIMFGIAKAKAMTDALNPSFLLIILRGLNILNIFNSLKFLKN